VNRFTARACAGAFAALCFALTAAVRAQVPQGVETFDVAWRTVRDSHFDKTLNGVNWDAVNAELRPKAAAARTVGDLRAVIRDMLGRLGQSHFALVPASADTASDSPRDTSGTIGFDVRLVDRDLLVTEVDPGGGGAAAGVHMGWKLRSVDGATTTAFLGSLPDTLEPRLMQVEAWRLAQIRLRGPSGSRAALTFEDGSGATVHRSVERRPEPGEPVTVGNLPTMYVRVRSHRVETPAGRPAGVIAFNVWMTAVDSPFQKAVDEFRHSDGIVIDLRGNPGGLAAMLMGISGHFIDERKPLGVMKTRDNELRFPVNPRRVSAAGERVQPFAGPVAILVDALSGSASECFAGGMQSLGRVRVFGQRSMGQALPALFTRLPNGDVLIHAYGDFVTADGTRLEGRGVVPDEPVALDRRQLLAGRDRTLEAALAWFDSLAAPRTERNR
jgi:carboxyl-terminal processing protease